METILKESKVIFLEAFLILFFTHQFPYSNEDTEVFSIILFFTIRLWMFPISVPFEFL